MRLRFKHVRDASSVARRLNRRGYEAYIVRSDGATRGSYKLHTELHTTAPDALVVEELQEFSTEVVEVVR